MAISRARSRAVPLLPMLLLVLLAPLIYSGTDPVKPSSSRFRHALRTACCPPDDPICVRPCSFQDAVELGAGAGPEPTPACRDEAS
jgi:hypothetical protein